MRYEYYGYPADFLFRYQKAITTTTTADVKRVAQKYLKPENLVTLVVGNQSDMKQPLTNLAAKVTTIDITITGTQPAANN
jgi:zinc protease